MEKNMHVHVGTPIFGELLQASGALLLIVMVIFIVAVEWGNFNTN